MVRNADRDQGEGTLIATIRLLWVPVLHDADQRHAPREPGTIDNIAAVDPDELERQHPDLHLDVAGHLKIRAMRKDGTRELFFFSRAFPP